MCATDKYENQLCDVCQKDLDFTLKVDDFCLNYVCYHVSLAESLHEIKC